MWVAVSLVITCIDTTDLKVQGLLSIIYTEKSGAMPLPKG